MEKKIILLITIAAILYGCSKNNINDPEDSKKLIDIAYSDLSDYEKESIIHDLNDAHVKIGFYAKGNCTDTIIFEDNSWICFIKIDKNNFISSDEILAAVTFNTKDDSLLGPIIVILTYDNQKVVGRVGRL